MISGQQPTIYGLAVSFTLASILFVVLRFKSRLMRDYPLKADDWTCLVALILTIAVTVDIVIMTALGGLGTHTQYTSAGVPADPGTVVIFGKTVWAFLVLLPSAEGMIKICVLLFYQRVFSTPRFVILTRILIGLTVVWAVTFTLALMLSCFPIVANWDFNLPSSCVNLQALFTASLATDVATDALILLLPVYKVWKLQMPRSRKLFVTFIFLLGGLVTVIGIIRIHFVTLIYRNLASSPLADTTWLYAASYYWTIIETNVGIISACLPSLAPLYDGSIKPAVLRLWSSPSRFLTNSRGSRERCLQKKVDVEGAQTNLSAITKPCGLAKISNLQASDSYHDVIRGVAARILQPQSTEGFEYSERVCYEIEETKEKERQSIIIFN